MLSSAEEMALEEGRQAEYAARYEAYGNDCCSSGERAEEVEREVRLAAAEPGSDGREMDDEEEVEQIDVERAHAYILQTPPHDGVPAEVDGIVPEEENDGGHQAVHGYRARQIGPLFAKLVPAEMLAQHQYGDKEDEGRKPRGVKQPLHAMPIATYEVACQKEVEEDDGLAEAGPLQPGLFLIVEP